ncbi:transcriptional regulator [Burkholderia anthina]|uniref:transcriptional regulator n=1 Tax=Burkholderia anthina TaxID=179879 RepID=UPI00158B8255|nr:YdaS family helix-turn-helix protein [Burkholderia anthina]
MNLKTYISTAPRGTAKKLADALKVSPSYLSQMASGVSSISPRRCRQIEDATDGRVTRRELRPNDWHEIWPDLAQSAGPPVQEVA